MKKHSLILLSILLSLGGMRGAAQKWNQAYQDYIDQYKDIAIREMLSYNIPASITLAQGLLESGAGRSELARYSNNHFGIKCHDWNGRKAYADDDMAQECFRAYDTVLESYEDHSQFLSSGRRYASLFELSHTDYKGWAYGLKSAGYATSPSYAQNLIGIIKLYNLHQYDYATSVNARKFHDKHSKWDELEQEDKTLDIRYCNGCYYIITREGDTWESLSEETGISVKRLAKYNERPLDMEIEKGEIIYLQKKKKHADKSFRNTPYEVKSGDTLYSISQRFAIRLKYLYKLNNLPLDYELKSGDELRIY